MLKTPDTDNHLPKHAGASCIKPSVRRNRARVAFIQEFHWAVDQALAFTSGVEYYASSFTKMGPSHQIFLQHFVSFLTLNLAVTKQIFDFHFCRIRSDFNMGYHFPFLSKFSDFFPDYHSTSWKVHLTYFQTTFDESIQFREKVQRYLGDVMKYVDHVLKNAGPPDLLRYVELDHCYMRNRKAPHQVFFLL